MVHEKYKLGVIHDTAQIHPTAQVHDSVDVGEAAYIGPFALIKEGTILGVNAHVGEFCAIGRNNKIDEGAVLQGAVRTGNGCHIMMGAVIKWGCILTSKVTVENGAFLGARVVTLGSDKDRKEDHGTYIATGAYIGGSTNIGPNISICPGAVVGAMSYVNEDIKRPGTYVGTPARIVKRKWHCKTCEAEGEIATKHSITMTQDLIHEAHGSGELHGCKFNPDNIIFD